MNIDLLSYHLPAAQMDIIYIGCAISSQSLVQCGELP